MELTVCRIWLFRLMTVIFKLMKPFFPYEKIIGHMEIQEGMTVVDYGCGPGNYVSGVARKLGKTAGFLQQMFMNWQLNRLRKFAKRKTSPMWKPSW